MNGVDADVKEVNFQDKPGLPPSFVHACLSLQEIIKPSGHSATLQIAKSVSGDQTLKRPSSPSSPIESR